MKIYRLVKLLLCLLTGALLSNPVSAQISYYQNFPNAANNPMGWSATGTYTPYQPEFVYVNAVNNCSVITDAFLHGSAGNNNGVPYIANVVSPFLGNSLGGTITVSFNCRKHDNGATGKLDLAYGPTSSGPWTTLPDILPSGNLCTTVTAPTFALAEPGPVYIRFFYYTNIAQGYPWSEVEIGSISVQEAALPSCSGVPASGTTTSWLPVSCGNSAIPLTVSPSPNLAGLAYQWQKSANGTSWTDIAGATTKYDTVLQTAATYYRRKTTCISSGQTAFSTSLLVTQDHPALACYCSSGATTGLGSEITNVTLGSVNNSTADGSLTGTQGSATGTADRYSNWTASSVPIPDLPMSVPLPFSIGLYTGSPGLTYTKIYIDFNQDGDLLDANEMVYSATDALSPSAVSTGTLTIPAGAALGNTLMRVVTSSSQANVSPCGTFDAGETEDYRVNIVPTTNCSGTPGVPVATGPASVCNVSQSITLNAGNIPAAGVTAVAYQWQKSAPGANTWTAIAGATTVPYTVAGQSSPTDYRLVVTCTVSNLSSSSNTVSVGTAYGTQCYCIPTASCAGYNYIGNVTSSGAAVNVNNTSVCTGGYGNYTAAGLVYPDSLLVVRLSVTSPAILRTNVYVDWNNNGYFTDPGEMVHQFSGGFLYTYALSFTVPAGTTTGNHRMRVQSATTATADPCATITGEVEDYTLVVVAPGNATTVPTCNGVPASASVSANGAMTVPCSMPARTLSASVYNAFTAGITLQWQQSADNISFTDIAGATGNSYNTVTSASTRYYRLKTICTASAQSSYSNILALVVSVATPVLTVSPATAAYCAGSAGVQLTVTGADTYSWSPATGLSCTTCSNPIANPATTTDYTVTGTNGGVCSVTATRTVNVQPQPFVATASASPGAVCPGGSVSLGGQPYNGTVTGFTGPFAPANWSWSQTNSNGRIDTSGAPGTIIFTSSDSTSLSSTAASDTWSIPITRSGNITFNWSYTTTQNAASDFLRYSANGTIDNLPGFSTTGANVQSGTAVIPVTAGSTFFFRDRSLTNTGGSSTTTITNFTAPGGIAATLQWYDAPTGGNLIPNPASVIPSGTSPITYYAQAVATGTGCISPARMASNPVIINLPGQWTGAIDTDWNKAGNWCDGVPTATSNIIVPGLTSVPNMPVLTGTGSANNILLQNGASLTISATGTLNIYGDLTGNGTLNGSAATVNLAGTGTQTIMPGLAVGTISLNGGSTKFLSGNAMVTNSLKFVNGMMDVGSNTLSLAAGATITGAGPSGYVRTSAAGGRLQRQVGTAPVSFPVGNSNYNPAILTNNGVPDNFSVGVRDEVLAGGTSGSAISPSVMKSVNHTWDVEEQVAGGSDVTMTLQWNANELNSPAFDYSHVYVAHYLGGSYTADPGYPTVNVTPAAGGYPGPGPYIATRNNITAFSPFTVASLSGIPLPVTLVSLNAENTGSRNRISWETAIETNMASYEVERSLDGVRFNRINVMPAKNKASNYTAYDNQPGHGLTYYRLKMNDLSGISNYSQIVSVFAGANGEVQLTALPNPASNYLTIKIYGSNEGDISLTDVYGRNVASAKIINGETNIDISALVQGAYFIRYINGPIVKTSTIIKQ